MGCTVVHGRRSSKYITLTRQQKTSDGKDTFFFVGRNGALRYGRGASASFVASDAFKVKLLDNLNKKEI